MKFCLTCHRFSGGGPICTQCGGSFGGRLCKGKDRHLNPPDAGFCTHCGTTELNEAAMSLSFGWVKPLAVLALIYVLGRWMFRFASQELSVGFGHMNGFIDPRIWLMERLGQVLIVLFCFYFLSGFIPGEAGPYFRKALVTMVDNTIKLTFKVIEQTMLFVIKLLAKLLGIDTGGKKKKKH